MSAIDLESSDQVFLWKEGSTQAQEDEANWILEALTFAYPGHPWAVRVYDGGFFIYHLEFPTNWGINCTKKKWNYSSSSELKRRVIMMGGEWLERANLKRGSVRDGDVIRRLDGIPERFQPEREKKPIDVDALVGEGQKAAQEQKLIVPDGLA